MDNLPTKNWRITMTAIDQAPAAYAAKLNPSLGIEDRMAGHLEDRRKLMSKQLEVVIDPADGQTEDEAALRLLKAKVRMLKIRMYSRFEDADVARLPMETVGWTVLRFMATSRDGQQVRVDLLLIIDTRTGGEQIVTSRIVS